MGCCSNPGESQLKVLITPNSLSLCILTWNVNAKEPSDSFEQLLHHNNIPFDIYVIGLQEIVDLTAKNLIVSNDANIAWETRIEAALNPPAHSKKYSRRRKHKYVKLRSIGLVGILLMVYVKHNLWLKINDAMSGKCASGLFDIAGNKGAVGIRFTLYETSMCFVCAHLAAHKKHLKARNEDYHKIIQKLTFVDDYNAEMDDVGNNEPSFSGQSGRSGRYMDVDRLSILQHDIVYFLGDINYRLDFKEIEEVFRLIRENNWTELLTKDQLLYQIETGRAFADFHEEKITFPPTFKYLIGTDEYEQSKKRIPSYCDRILWKIKKNNADKNRKDTQNGEKEKVVSCILYNCGMNETMSDHKPVYGLFQIQC